MLKLFWAPGQVCKPEQQDATRPIDTLRADADSAPVLQDFVRVQRGFAPPSAGLAARIDAWLAARAGGPVMVMVHGFQYDPTGTMGGHGSDDPFALIYGYPGPGGPDPRLSFLPLVGECDDAGGARRDVAIGFGWVSEGTWEDFATACWSNGYPYAALDLAPAAAQALAAVLAQLAARGAPVRVLAHSLGTRTFGQAIGLLAAAGQATTIERAVLLGGAEYAVDAAASFAGCGFDVFNLASRVDQVLQIGAQKMCHPVRVNGTWGAFVIGRAGLGGNARWLDLQINRRDVAAWFAAGRAPTGRDYTVDAAAESDVHPLGAMGHWAYYTNVGNRALVRDLLLDPAMTVAGFPAGTPDGVECPEYGNFAGKPIPVTPMRCGLRGAEMQVATRGHPASTVA